MGKPLFDLTKGIETYKADIEEAMNNPRLGGRDKSNLLVKFGILTRYLICWAKRHDLYTSEIARMKPQEKYRVILKMYEAHRVEGIENYGVREQEALEAYTDTFNALKEDKAHDTE